MKVVNCLSEIEVGDIILSMNHQYHIKIKKVNKKYISYLDFQKDEVIKLSISDFNCMLDKLCFVKSES